MEVALLYFDGEQIGSLMLTSTAVTAAFEGSAAMRVLPDVSFPHICRNVGEATVGIGDRGRMKEIAAEILSEHHIVIGAWASSD